MTTKILVANRGEIACRIISSIKKLGLTAVAVFSDADAKARHVRLADEVHHIGGAKAAESYLDATKILDVAKKAGVAAVHPGYGFLSENASFAESCEAADIVFVGPDAATIRQMGDKHEARAAAVAAGVPILPGSGRLDPEDDAAIEAAGAALGFPVLVKAAGGGGGIGLRPVTDSSKLVGAVKSTSAQAGRAFSDHSVYLEKLVQRARHIEVQIFGLGTAGAVHLFHRECSAQRRYQKILEEACPARIAPAAAQGMLDSALRLAHSTGYRSAGTVEFLYDDETGDYYFMEMNTRLQVEHPVTEMVTGLDLVALQLRLALGEDLSGELAQETIRTTGHSIELRVCAENPAKHFIPSPGPLDLIELPRIKGVRFDSGFETGDAVTPFYDSLVMKIIACGHDRAEAIAQLRNAVALTRIEGIQSNLPFLGRLLEHPDFVADRLHTRFVEDNMASLI